MTRQAIAEIESLVVLASRSDVGCVRSANEDSCETARRSDGARLLVVADGMGGHRGGATASRTAIRVIVDCFESDDGAANSSELLRSAIEQANARIYSMAQADSDLEGMGTTVVAFLLDAQLRASVAHVGDSRAYRYRQGHLQPLTTDHSVVAEMQRRGLLTPDEAAAHPRRNEILRSVGVAAEVEVEVSEVEITPGDRFLLCSDGLTGVVSDEEIAAIVQSSSPQAAVDTLIERANEMGGPDNITVQILAIPAGDPEEDPEATAPIRLSDTGLHAIESRKRERNTSRRLGTIVYAIAAGIAAFLIWRLLIPDVTPTLTPSLMPSLAPTPESPTQHSPENATHPIDDQTSTETNTPRRGIPR